MENLMIKAIRDFKKMELGKIRNIYIWYYCGEKNKVISATFNIEYVDKNGDYQSIVISEMK